MRDQKIYRQVPGVTWENVADGIAVSNPSATRLIRLNHVGAIVFLLTADALGLREIAQVLRENYGDRKQLEAEIGRCLQDLVESGIVIEEIPARAVAEDNNELYAQWLESDRALAEGRKADADAIYLKIAARPNRTEVDYLYGGLALNRLGKAKEAMQRLGDGCRAFPDSQAMRENYISIVATNGDIEMLLASFGTNPREACKTILGLPFCNATIRSALYCHFLKSEDMAMARHIVDVSPLDDGGLLSFWLMADAALNQGLRHEAEQIYKKIAARTAKTETEFLYIGLAYHRLGETLHSIDVLQQGRINFPDSNPLMVNLLFVCTSTGRIDLLLKQRGRRKSKADFLSAIMKVMVDSGQPELFLVHHKQYAFHLVERDFAKISRLFLQLLKRRLPDPRKREMLMFWARNLDGDPRFCRSLSKLMKSAQPEDDFRLDTLNLLTPMYIPARRVNAGKIHLQFQRSCELLARRSVVLDDPLKDLSVSFSPWHALFCLSAPRHYPLAMDAYHKLSAKVWPQLNHRAPHLATAPKSRSSKIRIGFMAHPAMPMMSGLMERLDRSRFEPIYLGPGKPNNSYTAKTWMERGRKAIFYDDFDMRSAIETISAQKLDIVLSAPSQPAVFYPVMAKLAHLHTVVLEPNWTDGFANSDYYISWRPAEPPRPEAFYRTKIAYLDHPPYWIDDHYDHDVTLSERQRQALLTRLTGKKPGQRVYLCPSTPPKLHPLMDDLVLGILKKDPAAIVTFLRNDFPLARNLHIRWREKFGKRYERIRFLQTLERADAHLLLHAVDCTLDSYPIGGMSSSFDGAILGIPTVTLPADIPFGRWLSSIYDYIGVSDLTADSAETYVNLAVRLATDRAWRRKKSAEIKSKARVLVENPASADGVQDFLLAAWKRYRSGKPNAHWISGGWQQ